MCCMKEPKDVSEGAEMGYDITPESAESNIRPAGAKDPTPPSAKPAEPSDASSAGFAVEGFKKNEFPLGCLPASFGFLVENFATAAMVPVSMAATTMIGALSSAIGAGLEFVGHVGKRTRANLFVLIPAQSGTGKDSIMNLAMAPLYAAETGLHDEWRGKDAPKMKAELSEIDRKLKVAHKSDNFDIEKCSELEAERDRLVMGLSCVPSIMVSDITREALSEKMAAAPGQAVASVSSEARGVISIIRGRYSSSKATDEDVYSGSWSGTPISVDRKGKATIRLTSPCMSAVWMTQPDIFREIMCNPAMVESGLLPRFLMHDPRAEPEQIPKIVPSLDKGCESQWAYLVDSLLTLRSSESPSVVIASTGALDVLRNYDNETRDVRRTGGEMHDVAPFAARWAENACRLVLVLHAAVNGRESEEHEITPDTARSAVEIVKWFSSEMTALFAAGRWEAKERRLERLCGLVKRNEGQVTLRDLNRRHGYRSPEVESLADLSGGVLHIVTVRPGPQGGAPSRVLAMTSG